MIQVARPEYVLDASVAVKWFTDPPEPDLEVALAVRGMHESRRCTLVVPEFSMLEVLNAVRFSARAVKADAARALVFLENLAMEVVPLDWDLLRRANAISWAYDIALYDAAYVALAELRRLPLLTADEAMIRKMKGHGSVVRLGDMQTG